MDSNLGYIMTVSNSIIGVSILAMPYCFKQCGILLAIVMLIISNIISRLTCHFLLKSAIMTRRRTFELLAFHVFGTSGKIVVELGIIGFLMGTCIAFFVIIGDLGPAIIAKMMDTNSTNLLRTYILIGVALFCVLPLGLLKNVDSLNSVSTVTIGFYFCLVLKTISESGRHFETGDWLSKVELWQPNGILQCLPIFAMAMSCQTQLFEIYDTLPNANLEKMNYVVKVAVNICVCVYLCVGFFGYVAFSSRPFTGNILMSFSPSWMTDVMKIGFVLSVAFSFPLVIFPCRASLYSLLFKKGHHTYYEGMHNHIPESKFKILTLLIVSVSLTIGLLIPNIEVVLGLVGSTIGTMICVIFPVTCFICISTKNTNERLVAQFLLFLGVIIMVMGTYRNLYAMEQVATLPIEKEKIEQFENQLKPIEHLKEENEIFKQNEKLNIVEDTVILVDKVKPEIIRIEPPQPIEPQDIVVIKNDMKNPEPEKNLPVQTEGAIVKLIDTIQKQENVNVKPDNNQQEDKIQKPEEVDVEAVKKEDNEIQEDAKLKEDDKKEVELIKILEKHKKEQESLLKEQKEIFKEIKKETEKRKEVDVEKIEQKIVQDLTSKNTIVIDQFPKQNEINKATKKTDADLRGKILADNLFKLLNKTKIDQKNDIALPVDILKKTEITEVLDNKKHLNNNVPVEKNDFKDMAVNLPENHVQNKNELNNVHIPNILTEILKNNVDKIVKDEKVPTIKTKEKENANLVGRDILANNAINDNAQIRIKRESDIEISTENSLNNNKKCETKYKTASPLIYLMTELSHNKDLLKLETNEIITGVKNAIKSNAYSLKRK